MKKLLIAYDGSPNADAMIDDLHRAGLPPSLEVLVLSVADVWIPAEGSEPPFPNALLPEIEAARAEAAQTLKHARALAESAAARVAGMFPGWKVEAGACADAPAWAILERARSWQADLIAVGSHGHSILERVFLGSVSQKVVAEAHCSVHVTRPLRTAAGRPPRVLLAVDGSPDSEEALRVVASRAWPSSTVCHVTTVVDNRMSSAAGWSHLFHRWRATQDQTVSASIQRMLEMAARTLTDAGLAVERDCLEGDPKQVLPRHAEQIGASLLFVGARGLHHQNRYFIGTTASAVASRAHCSIEIVRAAGPVK